MVDGSTSSCKRIPSSTFWILTFNVKADCIQDGNDDVYITINIKNIGTCATLKKLLFAEQKNCGVENSLRSCSVLNPTDPGPWCRAKCSCEEKNCGISVVVMEGIQVPTGMEMCEAGVTEV